MSDKSRQSRRMSMITAVVLAGGRGLRMGGVDKGLQHFRGMPLAMHALMRLQMQQGNLIAETMVNANRNLFAYQSMGVSVWPDGSPDEFAGPLAGFLAGLRRVQTPYLLTVPCDAPLFPLDLAQRLLQALGAEGAEMAVASAPVQEADGQRRVWPQPVFCLMRVELMHSLEAFIQSGGRAIKEWTAQHRVAHVAFDLPGDDTLAFANINTPEHLQALASSRAVLTQAAHGRIHPRMSCSKSRTSAHPGHDT
jgi:molybdenum cofactor guanylyltransferase